MREGVQAACLQWELLIGVGGQREIEASQLTLTVPFRHVFQYM